MDTPDDWERNLDMTSAVQGLQLDKVTAMRSLTDFNGDPIEFEEKEDGTIISKEVEGSKDKDGNSRFTYVYSLVPQTTLVTVSVAKIPKEDKTKARAATSEEEKEAERYNAAKSNTIKDNDTVKISKKSY